MAEIETKASQSQTGNQGVQLGFGTLIVIALIVTMCSGRSEMDKIQKDTAELKQQLGVIDKKLDALAPQGRATTSTGVEEPAASADANVAPSKNP
jgi:outer membrane murein-binding lipoprotein Lpp